MCKVIMDRQEMNYLAALMRRAMALIHQVVQQPLQVAVQQQKDQVIKMKTKVILR